MMNADDVRAMVEAKWPGLLSSPLAQAMQVASAMAQLEASDADAAIERAQLLRDAKEHALACLRACDGWTVETLGHNIESAFGDELNADECDAIAAEILGR